MLVFLNILTGVKPLQKAKKGEPVNIKQLFYSLTLDSYHSIAQPKDKIYCRNARRAVSAKSSLSPFPSFSSTRAALWILFSAVISFSPLLKFPWLKAEFLGVCGRQKPDVLLSFSWWSLGPSVSVKSEHFWGSLSAPPTSTHSESTCLRGTSLLNGVFTQYRLASGLCCAEGETDLYFLSSPFQASTCAHTLF